MPITDTELQRTWSFVCRAGAPFSSFDFILALFLFVCRDNILAARLVDTRFQFSDATGLETTSNANFHAMYIHEMPDEEVTVNSTKPAIVRKAFAQHSLARQAKFEAELAKEDAS